MRLPQLHREAGVHESDLLRFIGSMGWSSEPDATPQNYVHDSEGVFGALAVRTFLHQHHVIPEYRAYVDYLGRRPLEWAEIPPVPVSAFRSHDLSAAPPGNVTVTFQTSGTTVSLPGRVRLEHTSLYEASLLRNFARHLLPDGARLHALVFGPTRAEAPRSSLWFMADRIVREFCAGGTWIVQHGEPQWSLADEKVGRAVSGGDPLLLFGATLLFQAYFERCEREGIRFRLPPGSRVMDTGGRKGAVVEVSREQVQTSFARVLGIPSTHLVNEYGMAEMGSQFYEDTLLAAHEHRPAGAGFTIPPWVRTRVLHPETMQPVPAGKPGVLVQFDLANLEIPMAIQTEDVGAILHGRLHLDGRLHEAERRGCSLPFEKFVERERAAGDQA